MRCVNQNSLLAYYADVQPELTKRESEVFNCLNDLGGGTLFDVAFRLGVPVNTISGRFTGLRKKGKIDGSGVGVAPGGNRCTKYKIIGD